MSAKRFALEKLGSPFERETSYQYEAKLELLPQPLWLDSDMAEKSTSPRIYFHVHAHRMKAHQELETPSALPSNHRMYHQTFFAPKLANQMSQLV